MRIKHKYNPDDTNIAFDYIIQFDLPSNTFPKGIDSAEQYLNSICEWISYNFKCNFIILEHQKTCLLGGCKNNKKKWDNLNRRVDRSEYADLATYELRCFTQDCNWFLLRWS